LQSLKPLDTCGKQDGLNSATLMQSRQWKTRRNLRQLALIQQEYFTHGETPSAILRIAPIASRQYT
jgi:hypothetical protein